MHHGAFTATTGAQPTRAENQAIWNRFRGLSRDLQLPGRGAQLIEDYDELCAYYDRMVAEKLQRTTTLDCVVKALRRPKRPDTLPAVAAPLWTVTAPLVGHVVAVLGYGIMHPGVRALVPMTWTRRHDVEFAVLTTVLQLTYRWLPNGLTDTPLVRNRRRYERTLARYNGIGLTSFAAD